MICLFAYCKFWYCVFSAFWHDIPRFRVHEYSPCQIHVHQYDALVSVLMREFGSSTDKFRAMAWEDRLRVGERSN